MESLSSSTAASVTCGTCDACGSGSEDVAAAESMSFTQNVFVITDAVLVVVVVVVVVTVPTTLATGVADSDVAVFVPSVVVVVVVVVLSGVNWFATNDTWTEGRTGFGDGTLEAFRTSS